MHWTDYAIKATVYLTGPLMVLIGLLVFQRAWVVLVALAIAYLLVWLDHQYPPEERRRAV
jgi:uncharacterized membrane protein YphA (DoxX/SURF4 family)